MGHPQYILSLDQGTTSSRAIIFDRTGNIVASAQKEFPQIFPQPGWVEHDANEIWISQYDVIKSAMARSNITANNIAAIGISNQRETTVVWDKKTGIPIYNAIVWQDRRTAPICNKLVSAGKAEIIHKKTGLRPDSYFSATKICWILDNVEGARKRADAGELAFGTIDAWLLYKLSNGALHMTDISNASRTLLFNIHTEKWDDELLDIFNVPRSMLPEVRASSEIYGQTAPELLGSSVHIAGMAGDQQAATFGQACWQKGMIKNTYGTGCFMLFNTGTTAVESQHQLLTTIAWQQFEQPTQYALEGSVYMGGAVVQWLRDGLGIIQKSSDIETLAAQVSNSAGVYLVPAFVGLGAPYWDSDARGTMVGMTRGTTAAHIARAAIESIAFQSAELLEAMQQDAKCHTGEHLQELRVDGGASHNDLLMQFQTDILGIPVVRPAITETTALGAAYLAGLAVGFWQSLDEVSQQWQVERRFEPQMSVDEREQRMTMWKRAVQKSMAWNETN